MTDAGEQRETSGRLEVLVPVIARMNTSIRSASRADLDFHWWPTRRRRVCWSHLQDANSNARRR